MFPPLIATIKFKVSLPLAQTDWFQLQNAVEPCLHPASGMYCRSAAVPQPAGIFGRAK